MKSCNCEHWEVCPVCKPEWFDSEGNRLPPEPTPLQKAHGRIEELEQQIAERDAAIKLLRDALTFYALKSTKADVAGMALSATEPPKDQFSLNPQKRGW